MLDSSKSHKLYRVQIQDTFDFIYLCCHAVPALNGYIKAVENGSVDKIPNADYFKSVPDYNRLREIKKDYKKVLGNSLTLSIFSYFESYIFDVLKEILEFQKLDCGKNFLEFANEKRKDSFKLEQSTLQIKTHVKKLRDRVKPEKKSSYSKAIGELSKTSYQLPSQLFTVFGIREVEKNLDNFKAKDIPMIIEVVLGLELTQDETDTFGIMRDKRNKVAHGQGITIELKEAIRYAKFLRNLAGRIDQHICKYFLVIEAI